jgi:catechol 2,3-dioxygenase-like lactoylglutathione lyase family enzyme
MLDNARIDTTIPAVDVTRARRFYRDTLGLEEITPHDPKFSAEGAMFQVGDCTRFIIYRRPEPTRAEHTVATLTVDDLEKEMDRLEDRGVRFEQYDQPGLKTNRRGIAESDGMKAAWFKDTEGNILGIGEMPF